jgi:chemotaxis protein MotC
MKRAPLLVMTLAAAIAAGGPLWAGEEAKHGAGHGPAAPKNARDAKKKDGEHSPAAEEKKKAAKNKCFEALVQEVNEDPIRTAPPPPSGPAEKRDHPKLDRQHASAGPQPGAPNPAGNAAPNPEVGPDAHRAPQPPAELEMLKSRSDPDQPYKLIRTLEALQDKIATGNRDAHVFQRELLSVIGKQLPKVADAEWRKPRNARAGIVYALSGGDPGVLAKLLSLSPVPCIDEKLIRGLLDYSQGQNDAAWKLLSDVDPRDLDPRAAGHLALAQAMLIAGIEPKKAMTYLDLARIIAPGTLVEEAALRREAVIAASIEDFEMFHMLTSQYLRRFSTSVYAADFIRRFASTVAASKYAENEALFKELIGVLDSLNPDVRQSAYLALAKSGVFRGRVSVAITSARKLAAFSANDPKMLLRAKLYEAAAQLVTTEYDEAVAKLKSIDRASLPVRERPLFDAAMRLSERLHLPLQVTLPMAGPPPVSAEQGTNAEMQKLPRIVDDALAALGKAEELMKGDRQ